MTPDTVLPIDSENAQQRDWRLILFAASVAFWALRVGYWSITYELPFSDMQDYDTVARHILSSWDFSMDPFWRSYKAPVPPLMRAIELRLFGESMLAWQLFQGAMTFAGLIWFASELRKQAKSVWTAAALLILVAVSRSSIFWSLKFSSEGIAEGLLYLSCAAALFAWRKKTAGAFFLCGLIFSTAMLNRPNFMLSVAMFPAAFVIRWLFQRKKSTSVENPAPPVAAFVCGVLLLWAPWLARSYQLYGHLVPFVTAGPTSFIYGVWEVPARNPHGEIRSITWEKMLEEAPHRFPNDYEFYLHAQDSVHNWFKVFGSHYPGIVLRWIWAGLTDRNVQLTKVSRLDLFPTSIDNLLPDKSPWLIIAGLLGLILLACSSVELGLVALLSIPAWLFACCLQGNPRFLEPMIPLFLFGNIAWASLAARAIKPLPYAAHGFAASLLIYSGAVVFAAFAIPAPRPEAARIQNPGFETWVTDSPLPPAWVLSGARAHVVRRTDTVHDGLSAVELILDGDRAALYQDLDDLRTLAQKQFSLAVWVRASEPDSAYLAAVDGDKWYYSKRNGRVGEWERLEITATPVSDRASSFRIHLYVEQGRAEFDDVLLQISP